MAEPRLRKPHQNHFPPQQLGSAPGKRRVGFSGSTPNHFSSPVALPIIFGVSPSFWSCACNWLNAHNLTVVDTAYWHLLARIAHHTGKNCA